MSQKRVRRVKRKETPSQGRVKTILFIVGICLALLIVQQSYSLYELYQEKQQLEEQLNTLQEQNKQLEEEKKKLEDEAYIESVAREDLGLVKPGEVPYVR